MRKTIKVKTVIIGGGPAGLSIAHQLAGEDFMIIDKGIIGDGKPHPFFLHSNVPDFPAELQPVDVYQNIWDGESIFTRPTIAHMNAHSMKVNGFIAETSIRFIDGSPIKGYAVDISCLKRKLLVKNRTDMTEILSIDPKDKVLLVDKNGIETYIRYESLVCTAPLPWLLDMLEIDCKKIHDWSFSSIYVHRFSVPTAHNVHQIIFHVGPGPFRSIYRMSLMGDKIAVESMMPITKEAAGLAFKMIWDFDACYLGESEMEYGKFKTLPKDMRKDLMGRLSSKYEIYCLGRYATWSYKRFEHVWEDAKVIHRLMTNPFHI